MPPPETIATSHRLRGGQTLCLSVEPGARLLVRGGSAELRLPPVWLGEGLHSVALRLGEGEALAIEQPGWCVVAAAAPLEFDYLPPPRSGRLARWLGRISAWRSARVEARFS